MQNELKPEQSGNPSVQPTNPSAGDLQKKKSTNKINKSRKPKGMNLIDALNLTIQKVKDLMASGIKVETAKPLRIAEIKYLAACERKGELPKKLWNNVTFCSVTDEQLQLIFDTRNTLLKSGIYFDSGVFIAAERPSPDWQLDWSFTVLDSKEKSSDE